MAIVDATLYQLIPKEIRSKYARLLAKYSGVTDFGPALPDIRNLNRLQTIIYNLANTNRIISGGKSRLNDAMSGRASTMSIYGHGISSQLSLYQSNSAQTEFRRNESRKEREAIRYRNMMRRDIRSPLSVGDDDQFAFGANTGANRIGDFSYLAEQEEEDEKKKREIAEFAKKRFRQWNIRNDEKARYSAMMSRDIRSSLFVGDDDQYAFGADTGANRRGDFSYLAEQEEAQKAKRKRRLSAKAKITYDLLDDYDREMHDLRERYAGAPNARAAAENKILQDALKKMPKFMVDMLKNSKISTKALVGISKNPIVSKFIKHPIMAPLAALGVATHFGQKVLDDISKSNREMTSLQNVVNLFGKPSESFMNAAISAGIKDPSKISKLWGKLNLGYGSFERFASNIGAAYGRADYRTRLKIAQDEGWDEDTVALLDSLSGGGRLKGKSRRYTATANRLDFAISAARSSDADLLTWMSSWRYYIPFMKDWDVRMNPERVNRMYSEALNESVYDAVKSADDYQKTPKTFVEETLRTVEKVATNPVFQIGSLVIPGLNSMSDLVTSLLDMAQSKSDNEATLKSFDTGRR